MDALIQIDLDVVLKNKRHLYDEEIWDRMNEKACGQIRSCLTKEVKYLVKDEECAMTLWRTLEEKYLLKSPENRLHAMSQVYGFRMKPEVSMHDHVSRFEKLLADLKNLDEDIKDEVKAMILLHSLPEEYSHFVTTLIYRKSVIIFKDVCTTLTNLEIQNNNKNSERASSEALVSRDWAMEKKKKRGGKNSRSKSRSRNIARDECTFCHEKGHWRKDCPKAQKRDGKKPAAANMSRKDEDSDYLLSITPGEYVASSSEWILDTGAIYHLCPIKEWLTDFRNLESGYKVTIEDGIMKFTHGAMMILQGVRRHNLYYLKGGKKTKVKFGTANHDIREILEYVHSDNGVAERMNRILLEKVRCMLSNAGLDKKFWAEAVSYASHLVNRLPSAAIGGKTPMEMWSGKHAQDYDSLHIFGCPTYYHVKDGKLDPRARKVIFVGFKGGVKGFKLWDLEDKKFVCSRDVTFDEASMMKASSSQQVENKTKEVLQRVEFDATPYVPVSSTSKNGSTMEVTPRVEEEVVSSDVPQNKETIDDVDNDDFIATRRPRREIKKPGWLTKDMVVAYALPVIDDDILNTFGSANQTTPRYKARLVAKGFAQKEGIDYNEVFSPVVKHTSIRILLALVAEYELELAQLDVKTTFLHGDLEEEIYMIQPCGFRVAGKENHVCRSQEEYVFTLGGGPISWWSILQSTIALSTTEAEYMAATEAVKEAIWLKSLLSDLGVIQENIAVFCDNQSAIFLAKNQIYHARTKHIDVKYHYVREIIECGNVLLKKIDTKDNPLDMLTKVVSGVNFQHCLKLIQIIRLC
ncbi:Integrase catalytic domain-containing protein [Citrus sinensis]|uniref:Integrase catalytic domain-containing protein n=1 Tax=Citrus sinensis TaxID=2711 RepID=A0ACB8N6F6_CITSI|nr:Integrase catalytic domain-containing protein [Citrus sinensis]